MSVVSVAIDLNTLFIPSRAIRSGDLPFFSGRREVLSECLRCLGMAGSHLLIFGERGVGKTSVGWQLLELLASTTGNVPISSEPSTSSERQSRICIWLECKQDMKDIGGILAALLQESRQLRSFSSEIPLVYKDTTFRSFIRRTYRIDLSSMTSTMAEAAPLTRGTRAPARPFGRCSKVCHRKIQERVGNFLR